MTRNLYRSGIVALPFALAACGGGGGGVASMPPPPPPPPPVTSASVSIFPNPTPQTFASVGVSASGSGGFESSRAPIGTISTATSDQPQIRYTSDGHYEVQLPGGAWDTLIPFGNGTGDNDLTTAADPGDAELVTSTSRNAGYKYSEVASWSSKSLNRFGAFAFGVPTPGGAIPVSGSATYSGSVMGESDVYTFDLLATAYFRDPVQGTVNLDFDFAKGSLAGAMSLSLAGFGPVTPLGTFDFKDTVFSVGSTTYSGTFDTNADGQNFFLGQFTGPHAEETIGAWALPFIYSQGADADNKAHQAFGAWIAKKP